MPRSELDHIVVTAPTLKSGVEWVRGALGATPELGGEHPVMGTHNCLLKLGDTVYLEVIAPNPNAPKPVQPRWFELDRMQRDSPPRLAAWVARTSDIRTTTQLCSEAPGRVEAMSRGDLNWLITIPADGRLIFGGAVPMLIEWQTRFHPAARMRESGCELLELECFHPEKERVYRMLRSIGFDGAVRVRTLSEGVPPHLVARIHTPNGVTTLGNA